MSGEVVECPWVSCRYTLRIDVDSRTGEIDDRSDLEMADSCVLDVIERQGEATLELVGQLFGVTRERIRQIESKALKRLLRQLKRLKLQGGDELLEALLGRSTKNLEVVEAPEVSP